MILFRDKQLPKNLDLRVSLQHAWSVGWTKAMIVLSRVGVCFPFRVTYLNRYHFILIVKLLKGVTASEAKSKRFIRSRIKLLIETQSYRGFRLKHYLPSHGQRTRTNAGTAKSYKNKNKGPLWI